MEYCEEDFLLLSGIQHYAFCKRQWALIHIEQQWQENVHTAVGGLFHKKAHDKFSYEKRGDVLITRGLPVRSRILGISGECDIVEFRAVESGISLFGHNGTYQPFPVEYKKGHPKDTEADALQLAAQAMCLEEMFSVSVPEGALYYGEIKRRVPVEINQEIRCKVQEITADMHLLFAKGHTPKVKRKKECSACSLKDICLPHLEKVESVKNYIEKRFQGE